jgi:hypothetical protein
MKITNPFKSQYFLAFIGLIFLISYIWHRYIRERLPRDIPFQPTLLNLLLVITISFTYFYILLRIFKPKPLHPWFLQLLLILQPVFKPWYALDTVIRENAYFHRFINSLGKLLKYITNEEKNIKLYILWYMVPRVILLFLLLIDTFYLHKLSNIYTFGFLTLFIFICYYIIYCIRITITRYIEYLDYYFEVEITSEDFEGSNYFTDIKYLDNEMKIQAFIINQTAAFWFDNTPYEFKYKFIERYNTDGDLIEIPEKESKYLINEFYRLMPLTVSLNLFIETYDCTKHKIIDNKKTDYITKNRINLRRMHIIITSLYLSTWLYILFVNAHSLSIETFSPIFDIIDNQDPFSGLDITTSTE